MYCILTESERSMELIALKGVPQISQNFSTGASSSDCLINIPTNPDHSLDGEMFYPSAEVQSVYSTSPVDKVCSLW